MQTALAGRTVLVTGATGGIGGAVARWLGAEGARVFATGRRGPTLTALVEELRAKGSEAAGRTAELSKAEDVERLFDAAKAFGPLDAVVHCAGEALLGSFVEQGADDLDHLYASNVRATFLVLQHALRALAGRRRAQIVVPVGVAGRIPVTNGALYAASKHAVTAMVKGVTAEARRAGVFLTLLYNGATATPLLDALGQRPSRDKVLQAEDIAAAVAAALSQASPVLWSELVVQPEGALLL